VSPRAPGKSQRARTATAPARIRIDVTAAGVRAPLSGPAVRRVAAAVLRAERVRSAVVSITLVADAEMRRLNRRYLNRRGLTDVISFALPSGDGAIAGDVYLAPGAAKVSAAEHAVSFKEELTRLVIHGVLHVLGWDHPEGAGRTRSAMWKRQEILLKRIARGRA
jgi:probable rRNA maturation factor